MRVAARIVAIAKPGDAIEEFLTRDVFDLQWEILRLRRMKAGLLRAGTGEGVDRILSTVGKKNLPLSLMTSPTLFRSGPEFCNVGKVELSHIILIHYVLFAHFGETNPIKGRLLDEQLVTEASKSLSDAAGAMLMVLITEARAISRAPSIQNSWSPL
jgi:hypothetical protein